MFSKNDWQICSRIFTYFYVLHRIWEKFCVFCVAEIVVGVIEIVEYIPPTKTKQFYFLITHHYSFSFHPYKRIVVIIKFILWGGDYRIFKGGELMIAAIVFRVWADVALCVTIHHTFEMFLAFFKFYVCSEHFLF